jgi:hypothetical protein
MLAVCLPLSAACTGERQSADRSGAPSAPNTPKSEEPPVAAAASVAVPSSRERIRGRCVSLPPDELARSRPLPLLNPDEGTLTDDVLRLSVWVNPKQPPGDWNDALSAARLRGLTADELAAIEAAPPSQSDARIGMLTVAPDESTRVVKLEVSEATRSRSLSGGAELPIRRDTRAVRLLVAGQPVYELERPAMAPRVDAIAIGDPALYFAVRVRGSAAAVAVTVLEPATGRAGFSGRIRRTDETDPCWLLIFPPTQQEFAGATAAELTVVDVFHNWRFRLPAP